MNTITYIYHSCFVIDTQGRCIVFDIPSNAHLPLDAQNRLCKCISSKKLDIFFSHGHEDHFDPHIIDNIKQISDSYSLFISYDIYNAYPYKFSEHTHVLEPEEEYEIRDMKIKTFESNDEGNAYLINLNGIKIYFGGDLAEWVWPGMKENEIKFTINYFEEILDELRDEDIFIGFSNMDPRLKNFGGGIKFLKKVRPTYFVPMHTFGQYKHLNKLIPVRDETRTNIFIYSKIGDKLKIEI